MNRMFWCIITVSVLLGWGANADDPTPAEQFKSKLIQTRIAAYAKGVKDLERDFVAKKTRLAEKYLLELEELKKGLTKRGELDDALKVRDLIAEVKKELESSDSFRKVGQKDLRHVWVGTGRTYSQGANGIWAELDNGKPVKQWRETTRNAEYVEVFNEQAHMWARFFNDGLFSSGDRKGWGPAMQGAWKN